MGMVKMPETIKPGVDETEKVIQEYRQEIIRAIENQRTKLRELAEEHSKQIISRASQESSAIIARAQQQAERIISEAKEKANKDSEKIINEAKQKAEGLVEDADKRVRKEGKEKTKKEAEHIVEEAKAEAAKLMTTARQVSEKTANLLVTKATKEAEEIVSEARAHNEAKSKSQSESAQIMAETVQKAEQSITQTKSNISTDLEKLVLLIKELQHGLGKVSETAEGEIARPEAQSEMTSAPDSSEDSEPSSASKIEPEVSAIAVKNGLKLSPGSDIALEASTLGEENQEKAYKGRLELQVLQPVNPSQMALLEKLLREVPNSRLVGKGGSTGEISWTEIEISEPLPLISILKRMPPVEEVVAYGNNIIIALKDK
jgi:F0F1-type ATP synthase membrane subunit b/b'